MSFIFGIIVLLLDVWAVVNVVQSSASGGLKLAWVIGIVVFPILGFLVWFFAGPKGRGAIA